MQTVYVIFALLVPVLGYEVYSAFATDVWTFSEAAKALAHANLFWAYVPSVLVGHFFIHPPVSLATYLSETTELFVVVWIGWGLYWASRVAGTELPFGWVGDFTFVVGCVLVGAFCWTIHSTIIIQ